MFIHFFRPLLGVGWVIAMPMAGAQISVTGATPQDLAPRSTLLQSPAPLSFQSVMKDYRPYSEQPVGSWAEANRTVAQIGGWRAYAREASQPESKGAPASGAHHHGAKP